MATQAGNMNESASSNARSAFFIQWPAVFAGFFITMLVYFSVMSLGAALGANGIPNMVSGMDSVQKVGAGAGLWLLISCILALALGSYAAARVSGIVATRVGYYQGGVITALFFTMMVLQIGIGLGVVSYGLSAIKSNVVGPAMQIASQQPQVIAIAEDLLGDLNLRAPTEKTIQGVVYRVLYSDQNSAINYLATQAGIPRDQAQARYEALKGQMSAVMDDMARGAATAMRSMGWLAFALMTLGTAAAMAGGGFGAQTNIRNPVDSLDRRAIRSSQQQAYT